MIFTIYRTTLITHNELFVLIKFSTKYLYSIFKVNRDWKAGLLAINSHIQSMVSHYPEFIDDFKCALELANQ